MPRPSDAREWNASEYHRLSSPQVRWGERVLSGLSLHGDECVLDAGCGTGRLTHLLLENLPRGRVVGVDLSRNMLDHAQQNLPPDCINRVSFVAADLTALPFSSCFDGIFSTASFHWVIDHDLLFRNLFRTLRPGGWVHAQCGGGPNLAHLRHKVGQLAASSQFSRWLASFSEPWFFSDASGASARLRAAGFTDVETGLEEAPVQLSGGEEYRDFLAAVVVRKHLDLFPDNTIRAAFLQQLTDLSANENPPWVLDYWRLNLRARRPK